MSISTTITAVLAASALLLGSTTQAATATLTSPAGKLTANYAGFAGSTENAQSLVDGLRTGSLITLQPDPLGPYAAEPAASLAPSTGKLGYGNINIALGLAKTSLAQQGITNPTPTQLATALGGVLGQRSEGMGWGQIAKSMGVTLGSVVSASHTTKSGKKTPHTSQVASLAKADNAAGKSNAGGNGSNGGGKGGGNGGGNGGGKK